MGHGPFSTKRQKKKIPEKMEGRNAEAESRAALSLSVRAQGREDGVRLAKKEDNVRACWLATYQQNSKLFSLWKAMAQNFSNLWQNHFAHNTELEVIAVESTATPGLGRGGIHLGGGLEVPWPSYPGTSWGPRRAAPIASSQRGRGAVARCPYSLILYNFLQFFVQESY